MTNSFEQGPERIPNKEDVMEQMKRLDETVTLISEKSDEQGLYLLLMRTEKDERGYFDEYEYMRKGDYSLEEKNKTVTGYHNETRTCHIDITNYDADEMPFTGYNIAEYNLETGEWIQNSRL